jgi:hypothetical protein
MADKIRVKQAQHSSGSNRPAGNKEVSVIFLLGGLLSPPYHPISASPKSFLSFFLSYAMLHALCAIPQGRANFW